MTCLPNAIPTLKALIAALTHLEAEIAKLDAEIARRAKENDVARRLMTVPGSLPFLRMGTKPVDSWCATAPPRIKPRASRPTTLSMSTPA